MFVSYETLLPFENVSSTSACMIVCRMVLTANGVRFSAMRVLEGGVAITHFKNPLETLGGNFYRSFPLTDFIF